MSKLTMHPPAVFFDPCTLTGIRHYPDNTEVFGFNSTDLRELREVCNRVNIDHTKILRITINNLREVFELGVHK